MKKTLIVKSDLDSFELYINSLFQKENVDVVNIDKFGSKQFIKRRHWILKQIKELNKRNYNKIIIFDSFLLYLYFILFSKHRKTTYLWLWNKVDVPLHNKIRLRLFGYLGRTYTFDVADAYKYGLKTNTQFYGNNISLKSKVKIDAFFIGNDKGRYDSILSLANYMDSIGATYNFNVVPDSGKNYARTDLIIPNFIDYLRVLEEISYTRVIIDFVQKNQQGLSIRAMEAIFFSKKIITNNKKYLDMPFYDKNLVFIIGVEKMEDLEEFIKSDSDFSCWEEFVEYYSVKKWISRFE